MKTRLQVSGAQTVAPSCGTISAAASVDDPSCSPSAPSLPIAASSVPTPPLPELPAAPLAPPSPCDPPPPDEVSGGCPVEDTSIGASGMASSDLPARRYSTPVAQPIAPTTRI